LIVVRDGSEETHKRLEVRGRIAEVKAPGCQQTIRRSRL
jgi:hypothetical protein